MDTIIDLAALKSITEKHGIKWTRGAARQLDAHLHSAIIWKVRRLLTHCPISSSIVQVEARDWTRMNGHVQNSNIAFINKRMLKHVIQCNIPESISFNDRFTQGALDYFNAKCLWFLQVAKAYCKRSMTSTCTLSTIRVITEYDTDQHHTGVETDSTSQHVADLREAMNRLLERI